MVYMLAKLSTTPHSAAKSDTVPLNSPAERLQITAGSRHAAAEQLWNLDRVKADGEQRLTRGWKNTSGPSATRVGSTLKLLRSTRCLTF